MRTGIKTFLAVSVDALSIFVGVYGIIFGIITAYNINAEKPDIIFTSVFSAAVFSALFHNGRFKKTFYIVAFTVCIILFFAFYRDIANGFSLFIGMLTQRMSNFSDIIKPTIPVSLSAIGRIRAFTVLFSFLSALLSFLIAVTLIKVRRIWTTVIVSVPVFSVCLFFVKERPDIVPVIAFFAFLASVIFSGAVRKGGEKKGAAMLSFFLALTLAFLLVVNAAFPDSPDNRSALADKMYRFFSGRLPITLNNPPDISFEDSSGYDESSWSVISGDDSSGGPIIEGPKAYQMLDLTGSAPVFSGAVVMRVRSFEVGPLLLRGYSLDRYNGSSWTAFGDDRQRNLNNMIRVEPFTDLLEGDSLVNAMSFATYAAMTAGGAIQNHIGVSEVNSGGEIIYTPYFPLLTDDYNFTYLNSSVVLHTHNINSTDKVRASYTILSYNSEELFSSVHNTDGDRQNNQYARITELENIYRHYAYEYYTEISDSTRSFLQDYIRGEGFDTISDRAELVDAVTEFVKNSAKYNLQTPMNPRGTDFVEHFLSVGKQGYCVHFATAAALIFRTLGIPARYVSGYSVNFKEDNAGRWINVLDKNAHSWVEVYFDGIGWVPVDVTPSEPSGSDTTTDPGVSLDSSEPYTTPDPSGDISSSSEPYSSGENDSSAAEPSISSDATPTPKPNGKISFWIYAVLFGVMALISVLLRRRGVNKARKKEFGQADTNKAVLAAWKFIERLIPYG